MKTGGELMSPGWVSSSGSCFNTGNSDDHRVTLVKYPVIIHERGMEFQVVTRTN